MLEFQQNEMGEHRNHLREWAELVGDSVPEAVVEGESGQCERAVGVESRGAPSRDRRN
ncbi:MAG: hypothetical protein ABEJ22_03285 [Haloferacaceae archaeon]